MVLKDRVRAARKTRKLTQQELADAADLSLSFVVLLESGERENMHVKSAVDLAAALGCSLAWLIEGTGVAPEGIEAA